MRLKIKVGDEVQVITGKNKGRKGIVLAIRKAKRKICVKDVFVQTLFSKKEGLQKKEGFIDYSNVKLIRSMPKKAFKKTKRGSSKGLLSR